MYVWGVGETVTSFFFLRTMHGVYLDAQPEQWLRGLEAKVKIFFVQKMHQQLVLSKLAQLKRKRMTDERPREDLPAAGGHGGLGVKAPAAMRIL